MVLRNVVFWHITKWGWTNNSREWKGLNYGGVCTRPIGIMRRGMELGEREGKGDNRETGNSLWRTHCSGVWQPSFLTLFDRYSVVLKGTKRKFDRFLEKKTWTWIQKVDSCQSEKQFSSRANQLVCSVVIDCTLDIWFWVLFVFLSFSEKFKRFFFF